MDNSGSKFRKLNAKQLTKSTITNFRYVMVVLINIVLDKFLVLFAIIVLNIVSGRPLLVFFLFPSLYLVVKIIF